MRDPHTDHLLTHVRRAVAEARMGGVSVHACIFDAACAAVDGDVCSWPSPEARRTANDACRGIEEAVRQRRHLDVAVTPPCKDPEDLR